MSVKPIKYLAAVLMIAIIATSCKKVIDVKVANDADQLVIEGGISNEPGPQYVRISRSVPFTSSNTYPPVTGATVTLNNNNGRITPFPEGPEGYYAINPALGTMGRTYTLSVEVDGKTYKANSTMPNLVVLDSIASRGVILGGGNTNKRLITVYFQDPAKIPNQYRFVEYVNRVQVNAIFAFDDEFIDGKYVNLDLQQNDIDILPKDTVTVEMQCIDSPIKTYWFSLAQQGANNPGGAITPANPPTNFTPATLGYFSAHTTQSITLIVQ